MYFLSLLAPPPSITFAQQMVSTVLLNICFFIGIQKAVSSLFSLVWWIKTMSPRAFRMSLGRSLWPLSYSRNVSGCLPKTGMVNRFEDLQYRERHALLRALSTRRAALQFFYHIPIFIQLAYLPPSPGIPLPAYSGIDGQELTKCPLNCRMSS